MKYSFHPHAEKELEEIERHYDEMRVALGDRFRAEIESTIARILKFPTGWQQLSGVVRRCRLISFPYGIIYRVKDDEIRDTRNYASTPRAEILDISSLSSHLLEPSLSCPRKYND